MLGLDRKRSMESAAVAAPSYWTGLGHIEVNNSAPRTAWMSRSKIGHPSMALVENIEAMLARGQDNALVRYSLGNEYLKLGQPDKAIGHLQIAVTHDPKYSAAWKLLGKALADSGRRNDAIKAYEEGIRAAQEKGDIQAAKEMTVFLERLQK
jgi:predicted Zn-dependent protease